MAPGNVDRYNFKKIFLPPTLILRQLESVLLFRTLIKWKGFGRWLTRNSFKSIPVSAGAIGMGCIGFPNHPVWEVTNRCNLNCIHCHTEGGHRLDDELDTKSARRLIDELAQIREFRMLVYTGGEPFMREDLFELLEYSKKAGFVNVIASNGMMIDDEIARDLKSTGVAGIAVSLDSDNCQVHNDIRNNPGAFEKALKGIEAIKKAGILLQVNTTAMDINFDDLDSLVDYVDSLGSGIMLMYQLVPVGRGIKISNYVLDTDYNERLLTFLAEKQKKTSVLIEPVAGPQYWAYLLEKSGRNNRFWMKMAERSFYGCAAGDGLVYIKANGDIWPCPFIEISAGNIRDSGFKQIWENSEVFKNLRNRSEKLSGTICRKCRYNIVCGGCRGRAMAHSGDYMGDDPSCFIHDDEKDI